MEEERPLECDEKMKIETPKFLTNAENVRKQKNLELLIGILTENFKEIKIK